MDWHTNVFKHPEVVMNKGKAFDFMTRASLPTRSGSALCQKGITKPLYILMHIYYLLRYCIVFSSFLNIKTPKTYVCIFYGSSELPHTWALKLRVSGKSF